MPLWYLNLEDGFIYLYKGTVYIHYVTGQKMIKQLAHLAYNCKGKGPYKIYTVSAMSLVISESGRYEVKEGSKVIYSLAAVLHRRQEIHTF